MNKTLLFGGIISLAIAAAAYAEYQLFSTLGDNARITDAELSAIPFIGVTTDGNVIPDLFPVAVTGVSTQAMQDTATDFIAALTDTQKTAALFDVDALDWRKWSNVDDYTRAGVNLNEMTDDQVAAAWAMLAAFLSDQGSTEIRATMRLNATLGTLTGQQERFNAKLYWFTMMGTPDPAKLWGFQVDGHHVAFNFFVLGDQLSITPCLSGGRTARRPRGHDQCRSQHSSAQAGCRVGLCPKP
jgi:hypothetical protein